MSFFNPKEYSTSSYDNSEEIIPEVVEKGHKNMLNVDLVKFEESCKKFREKKDLKIRKLTGSDKEDFNLMVSYVHLLYGTTYYNQLYDRVKKHFKNVGSVKPGTVGAYFAGCLTTVSSHSDSSEGLISGCSISCAGSMPLPQDEEGWSFCDKSVILGEKDTNGYSFSFIKPANSPEDLDPAYLFVESSSLHDFTGFSREEKDYLRDLGCKKVKLIGYKSDSTYSELYQDSKSIEEIKHRHPRHKKKEGSNTVYYWGLGIVIFIILLTFLIYLTFKYYN